MKKLNFKLITVFLYLTLFISGCVTVPRQPVQPAGGAYHIVTRGQTLYRIAKIYNTDINQLKRINKIIDPTQIEIGQRLLIPRVCPTLPIGAYKPVFQEDVKKIVGPKYRSSYWRYITLHHSATFEGNARCFDRNHRSRKMGGLFYHFVLGNGTYSGDGEIEVGWRWRKQKEVNRPADIQICLVGNFSKQTVSNAQFAALVKLISTLQDQYHVPLCNIREHRYIRGKNTECPGTNFPFNRLIAELRKS